MTYDMYKNMFIIAGILAAIFLMIAIVLFVVFRIPTIIGDLSGRNARKAIDTIREKNTSLPSNGRKRAKTTVKLFHSTQKLTSDETVVLQMAPETEILQQVVQPYCDSVNVNQEITLIHTDETIG